MKLNSFVLFMLRIFYSVHCLWDFNKGCPSEWISIDDQCYTVIVQTTELLSKSLPQMFPSAIEANQACGSVGGYLATVPDQTVNDGLVAMIQDKLSEGSLVANVYIGLSDGFQEGQFSWMSSSNSITFTNWMSNSTWDMQPSNTHTDNGQDEDCVYLSENGSWFDTHCCSPVSNSVICQLDPVEENNIHAIETVTSMLHQICDDGGLDSCVSGDLCLHGGSCVDGIGTYSCVCQTGYTGSSCQTEIKNTRTPKDLDSAGLMNTVNDTDIALPNISSHQASTQSLRYETETSSTWKTPILFHTVEEIEPNSSVSDSSQNVNTSEVFEHRHLTITQMDNTSPRDAQTLTTTSIRANSAVTINNIVVEYFAPPVSFDPDDSGIANITSTDHPVMASTDSYFFDTKLQNIPEDYNTKTTLTDLKNTRNPKIGELNIAEAPIPDGTIMLSTTSNENTYSKVPREIHNSTQRSSLSYQDFHERKVQRWQKYHPQKPIEAPGASIIGIFSLILIVTEIGLFVLMDLQTILSNLCFMKRNLASGKAQYKRDTV